MNGIKRTLDLYFVSGALYRLARSIRLERHEHLPSAPSGTPLTGNTKHNRDIHVPCMLLCTPFVRTVFILCALPEEISH
jgi:hypothetical protein